MDETKTGAAPALPAPLVPAYVDLRKYPDMPLEVGRIRGSELSSDVPPEFCWAALLLWCAAWHEVPAGSIPDNSGWQAAVCGYKTRARIDPEWETVRPIVLRNFVLCSDGRLYHTTVSKKALESFTSMVKFEFDRMCDRLWKANKIRVERGLEKLETPSLDDWLSAGRPRDFHPNATGIPPEKALKGREGKGSERNTTKRSSGSSKTTTAGKDGDEPPVGAETWESYRKAFVARYQVEPMRNAVVNTRIASFVKRVGAENAPSVAAFFVTHNQPLYVSSKHDVTLLLRDAEKLYADWKQGSRGAPAAPARNHDLNQVDHRQGEQHDRLI